MREMTLGLCFLPTHFLSSPVRLWWSLLDREVIVRLLLFAPIITVWKGTLHPQPDFLLSPSFHNHLQLSFCSSSAQPTFHRPPLQYFRKFCTKVSNDFKLPNIVDKVLVFILPLWYSRHWQNVSQEHYVPLTPEYHCSLKCQHNFQ